MSLIITLICIAIEQFTHQLAQYRQFNWLKGYLLRFSRLFAELDKTVLLTLALLPFVALTLLILANMHTLLWFLAAVAILWFSLGPQNTQQQLTDYHDAVERDDPEAAYLYANQLQQTDISLDNSEQLNQHVINAALVQSNERTFAVLFWFMVLGPVGALLFRISSEINKLSQDDELHDWAAPAQRLQRILAWLPARLSAFSYALAGSMHDALHNWRQYQCNWSQCFSDHNCGVLVSAGLGALQISPDSSENSLEQVNATMSLISRALVIWVSCIALLTLAGFA